LHRAKKLAITRCNQLTGVGAASSLMLLPLNRFELSDTIRSAIFGLLIWLHSDHGHGNMTMDTRRIP
jgi:hypothetical protein